MIAPMHSHVVKELQQSYGSTVVKCLHSVGVSLPADKPIFLFTSISKCSIFDPKWNNSQDVPLVYERFNWQQGIFIGTSGRSKSIAEFEDIVQENIENRQPSETNDTKLHHDNPRSCVKDIMINYL
ncbi:unnamed protein product [Rotaria sp. Silwood1]|nr:unnamed protein product [Rotaria sp. Silwood1]